MIIPQSYLATLLLMILSMLCWGSWANTLKMAGPKWRFELFYFDYAFGTVLLALVAAFTFGSLGFDGFPFLDDLMIVSKRQWLYGFGAGIIFNLANMLLVAAITLAGMSIAFPVGIGTALVIGTAWNYLLHPAGNPALLTAGCVAIVAAIVVASMAHRAMADIRFTALAKAGKTKKTVKIISVKGVVIALISGLLMGSFYPLVEMGKVGETPMGPYSIGFMFALGILLSTFVFNMFFMNLPVEGEPVEFFEYFQGTLRQHLLGIAGGAIWFIGAIANFVAASAPETIQVGPAISYAFGQGAFLVSTIWGLTVWKEFAGADSRVRSLLIVMIVLSVCGLAMVSLAPLFVLHS